MADVQKQFEEFHDKIRVDYDTLREKRNIVLNRLRSYLKKNKLPSFDELHQGSYAMGMGIAPIGELEYDMDIGLRFQISDREYDAAKVHGWVFEGVKDHTDEVDPKGPCVRVTYATSQGVDGYHMDLVAYAWQKEKAGQETFKLAHKTKGWRPADPPALLAFVEKVREPFAKITDSKTQTDQFRRCVRDLKRWNDEAIPKESEDKPTGLALVLLCSQWLKPTTTVDGNPDDLKALRELATTAATQAGRLVAKKPTPEHEDILSGLSEKAMAALKGRFADLAKALDRAARERDVTKACNILQAEAFGKDFPVPTADAPRKTAGPAIITSSSSAA